MHPLVRNLGNGGGSVHGWELSVSSSLFCWVPKTALKKIIIKSKNTHAQNVCSGHVGYSLKTRRLRRPSEIKYDYFIRNDIMSVAGGTPAGKHQVLGTQRPPRKRSTPPSLSVSSEDMSWIL